MKMRFAFIAPHVNASSRITVASEHENKPEQDTAVFAAKVPDTYDQRSPNDQIRNITTELQTI